MKFFILCLGLIPALSFADPPLTIRGGLENVALNGSISFLRCVPPAQGEIATCRRAEVPVQPFMVNLNSGDGPGISGEGVLKAVQDGIAFEATIALTKTFSADGSTQYKVEVYLDESTDSSSSFDFVGRTIVNQDIAGLNEIMWTGKALSAGSVTLTPFISLSR
ncbi:MAG: hypothetical protein ACXVC0_00390 [Bdellovibrionota bacterium]